MIKLYIMISVVINTLNEEKNLPHALNSIKDLADEVVVVDMMSDDKTQEIAKEMGAKVYEHKREGYVEPARNFAIQKALGEWILILDADERISKNLKKKLKSIAEKSDADYYRLPRKNIVFGKWIKNSRWWPDYNIRFFKKGYVEWNEIIHSVPITSGKGADLEKSEDNAIIHNHYETIEQYITRMNRYTTHQAKNILKEEYEFNWKHLITKPSEEFLSRYFQGQGYKDGIHGLALSLLQSFSELVVYLKLWQLSGFEERNISEESVVNVIKRVRKDENYWFADTLLREKGGVLLRIKRKFRLP